METLTLAPGSGFAVNAVQRYVIGPAATSAATCFVTLSTEFVHDFSPACRKALVDNVRLKAHTSRVLDFQKASVDLDRISRPASSQSEPVRFDPDDYPLVF